jgi:hypothetical protein
MPGGETIFGAPPQPERPSPHRAVGKLWIRYRAPFPLNSRIQALVAHPTQAPTVLAGGDTGLFDRAEALLDALDHHVADLLAGDAGGR